MRHHLGIQIIPPVLLFFPRTAPPRKQTRQAALIMHLRLFCVPGAVSGGLDAFAAAAVCRWIPFSLRMYNLRGANRSQTHHNILILNPGQHLAWDLVHAERKPESAAASSTCPFPPSRSRGPETAIREHTSINVSLLSAGLLPADLLCAREHKRSTSVSAVPRQFATVAPPDTLKRIYST